MRNSPMMGPTSDDMVSKAQAVVEQLAAITAALAAVSVLGSFTMPAAATFVVLAPGVKSGARVFLQAANASAATLMSSSKALYQDTAANVVGASFTVSTADATNAAGTEIFSYFIVNP